MKQKRNFPVGITAMQATEGTNPPPPHPTPPHSRRKGPEELWELVPNITRSN